MGNESRHVRLFSLSSSFPRLSTSKSGYHPTCFARRFSSTHLNEAHVRRDRRYFFSQNKTRFNFHTQLSTSLCRCIFFEDTSSLPRFGQRLTLGQFLACRHFALVFFAGRRLSVFCVHTVNEIESPCQEVCSPRAQSLRNS